MNNWIPPHIEEQFREIEKHQTIKEQEREQNSFIKNLPSPNYVLIDAALWGDEIDELFTSKASYRSLFRGSTGLELWSVAPYLIEVSSNEEFVQTIKAKDPIERRITWLYSTEDIDSLRKHLRRFLRMKMEDDSYIYFRFYDPYVVNSVFPDFTEEQFLEFFEKVEYIKTEDHRIGDRQMFYLSSKKELQIISQTLD